MEFIYHGVPQEMRGNILYPLFDLKKLFPAIYEGEIKKYDDHPKRKELPFKKIGKLNCARGEVLHCSSIHPALVFQALKTIFPDGNRSVRFYKIPLEKIRNLQSVLFDMNRSEYEFGKDDPDEVFDLIDPQNYLEIRTVPAAAYTFFQEWKDRGERGAPAWGRIPHVFVKGQINVEGLEIIDWRDPII